MIVLRTLLLAAMIGPVAICHAEKITDDRLIETARAALAERSAGMSGSWEFISDPVLPSHVEGTDIRIHARGLDGRWPRRHIGVPVQVWADERLVQSRMVWFTVRRWQIVPVYARDARAGDELEHVQTTIQRRDMADFGDREVLDRHAAMQPEVLRLRRSVRAGQPVLQEDFEVSPAVLQRKEVALTVRKGQVTLSTRAVAQENAAIGDPVRVLPSGGEQWVLARATGPGEVIIEE